MVITYCRRGRGVYVLNSESKLTAFEKAIYNYQHTHPFAFQFLQLFYYL